MKPIILDCDGVLLEWEKGFAKWCGLTGEPEHWDLSNWTGFSADETMALVKEFNASPAFGLLKPVAGAYDALNRLRGHPLYVLTSCGAQANKRRTDNLKIRFGDIFTGVICLDLGVSKSEYLSAFYTLFGECYWIEDNENNARMGSACGHKSIMLRRSHNVALESKSDEAIKWVSDWPEILAHLS